MQAGANHSKAEQHVLMLPTTLLQKGQTLLTPTDAIFALSQ